MNVFMMFLFGGLIVWGIGLIALIVYGIGCFCINMKYRFINWNLKRKGHALNKINY